MTQRITIKYMNGRLLQTVDLNTAIRILLEEFSDDMEVRFAKMTDTENESFTEVIDTIAFARRRFTLWEHRSDGATRSRIDLEDLIERLGQK